MESRAANLTIPHAPPFLFVDSIVEINPSSIICDKRIERADKYLVYNTGRTEYVSQAALIECILQSGAYLMKAREASNSQNQKERKMYFAGSRAVKFGVTPSIGDMLSIEVAVVQRLGNMARLQGKMLCKSEIVVEGTFMVAEK